MTKIKTRNYLLVILLLTTIVCGVIGGIAINSKAFAEDEYTGEIAPRYADNIYTYVNVNGAEVKVDFMGRDVLWPFQDQAQVRLKSDYGSSVSFSYTVKLWHKSENGKVVTLLDNMSATLGGNIDATYKAKNVGSYKQWDVYEATLELALTYKGVTVYKDYLIRFE